MPDQVDGGMCYVHMLNNITNIPYNYHVFPTAH